MLLHNFPLMAYPGTRTFLARFSNYETLVTILRIKCKYSQWIYRPYGLIVRSYTNNIYCGVKHQYMWQFIINAGLSYNWFPLLIVVQSYWLLANSLAVGVLWTWTLFCYPANQVNLCVRSHFLALSRHYKINSVESW